MFENQSASAVGATIREYRSAINFCALSPLLGQNDIQKACNVAHKNKYNSVCILPYHTYLARNHITINLNNSIKLGVMVDFPLGANSLPIKLDIAKRAISQGADIIICTINLSNLKEGNYMAAKKEVSRLVRIARKKQIGIMIESSALNREQLEKLCKICQKCKVDYIYTHTGFGSAGASAEIVQTLVQMLQNKCQVVACGGISSREEAWTMLRAGATQIATSREL